MNAGDDTAGSTIESSVNHNAVVKRAVPENSSSTMNGDDEKLLEDKKKEIVVVPMVHGQTANYFLEVSNDVQELWPIKEESPGIYQNAIEKLANTPYLADCLRSHLNDAKQIFSDNNNNQLTPEDERRLKMYDTIPDESDRDTMKQFFLDYSKLKRESKLKDIRSDCMEIVGQVDRKTVEVRSQLLALAGLSRHRRRRQEAEQDTVTEEELSSFTDDDEASTEEHGVSQRTVLPVAEYQSLYSTIIENTKDIDQVLPGICSSSSSSSNDTMKTTTTAHDGKAHEKMAFIAKTFANFLSTSEVLDANDPDYKNKTLNGLKFLQDELQPDNNNNQPSATAAAASIDQHRSSGDDDDAKYYYMPGPESHEKDGTQPFLQLLLRAIGECWNPSASSPSSNPAKIFIRKELQWDAVIFDDTLTVPMEVGPGCCRRKNNHAGPMSLLNEARDQVLSHLAKHLFIGFNFATFGMPCHATGIIANMAAVQILHLRYENVGSPEAKLELYQSKLAPLMSLNNFKRWTASMRGRQIKKELDDLEVALFGNDTKRGMDDEIPKGIQILLNLMNQPSKKLRGICIETNSNILGDQVGTGATAVVFRRAGADNKNINSVVKLSRDGIKTGINNELKILQALAINNGKGTSNKHIPSIIHSEAIQNCMLTVQFGYVLTELPAIEIAPVGKQVASFLLSPDIEPGYYLRLVLDGIKSALEYMHSKDICHCDVSPTNIIIASDTAGTSQRAVLIDYSQSSWTTQTFHCFFGTANYVHRGIFRSTLSQTAWKPQPEHDKAGLGFTMTFFANGCVCTLDVGDYPFPKFAGTVEELEEIMETRLEKAITTVENATIADDLKCDIKKLLSFDIKT